MCQGAKKGACRFILRQADVSDQLARLLSKLRRSRINAVSMVSLLLSVPLKRMEWDDKDVRALIDVHRPALNMLVLVSVKLCTSSALLHAELNARRIIGAPISLNSHSIPVKEGSFSFPFHSCHHCCLSMSITFQSYLKKNGIIPESFPPRGCSSAILFPGVGAFELSS